MRKTHMSVLSVQLRVVCIFQVSLRSWSCSKLNLPGAPLRWTAPSTPFELSTPSLSSRQSGATIHPFEANCASLRKVIPDFDFHNVDVYCNRGSLTQLLNMCKGKAVGRVLRFDAYLLRDTLILYSPGFSGTTFNMKVRGQV
jgi:hypothetical protein